MPYQIGICVQYSDGLYTLAGIQFNNDMVVVWMPTGNEHQLSDGTKHNPHATYHGDGIRHLASYSKSGKLDRHVRYPFERQLQPLSTEFRESENVTAWGFGREDAQLRGHNSTIFDDCLVVDADQIEPTGQVTLTDSIGEFTSSTGPHGAFQVDLIAPGRHDLRYHLVPSPEKILAEKLIESTFPWCMITVYATP